jgi:prepilin-type processing-associated H-X9-DG protein
VNPSYTMLRSFLPAVRPFVQRRGMMRCIHDRFSRSGARMYAFPPPNPPEISALAFAANVLLMIVALAAALGGFQRHNTGLRSILRRWGIASALVVAICGFGLAFEECRTYMPLYFGFIWAAALPVTLASVIKQVRGNRPAIRSVLGWLAAIGFLVFLCSPAISIAKQAGRRVQCMNNLRNIGLLFPTEENQAFRYPNMTTEGNPPLNWRTRIYTEFRQVEDSGHQSPTYERTKPWNDPANVALARERFGPFVCPANFNPVDELNRYYTAYAAVTGPQTAFPGGKALAIAKFADGTSNTIAYCEAPGLRIVWTEPRDIDISRDPVGINLPGPRRAESPGTLSSYHSGGATAVFADGSVRFLSNNIKPAVLQALLTATGGESLGDDGF